MEKIIEQVKETFPHLSDKLVVDYEKHSMRVHGYPFKIEWTPELESDLKHFTTNEDLRNEVAQLFCDEIKSLIAKHDCRR